MSGESRGLQDINLSKAGAGNAPVQRPQFLGDPTGEVVRRSRSSVSAVLIVRRRRRRLLPPAGERPRSRCRRASGCGHGVAATRPIRIRGGPRRPAQEGGRDAAPGPLADDALIDLAFPGDRPGWPEDLGRLPSGDRGVRAPGEGGRCVRHGSDRASSRKRPGADWPCSVSPRRFTAARRGCAFQPRAKDGKNHRAGRKRAPRGIDGRSGARCALGVLDERSGGARIAAAGAFARSDRR